MKRRLSLPLLAVVVAPIALASTPAMADDSGSRDQRGSQSPASAPATTTAGNSTPPSAPADGSKRQEILGKLAQALTKVANSPLPDDVKAQVTSVIQGLIDRLNAGGTVTKADMESLASTIETAIRGAAPKGTMPSTKPTSVPVKPSTSPQPPAGAVSVPAGEHDESDDDDSQGETDDDSDEDSASPTNSESPVKAGADFQFDASKVRRTTDQLKGDLASNITRAVNALNLLPQSDARDAALAALAALQTRVDAGETIPPADVLAVFRQVHDLVSNRVGDDDSVVDPAREPGGVTEAQKIQRMLGIVNEALSQLSGNLTPEGADAIAQLEALKTTLESGVLPDHDSFEAAIDAARSVLGDTAATRAALMLSGVIGAVQSSNMPDDVKAHLVSVLEAARTEVLTNPNADVQAVVRAALEEVRAARIAGAIQHMLGIADRLEQLATNVGNSDALLLIAEARALLQPADGSTPSRDDMHQARHLLVRVVRLLRPVTTPTTTVPPVTSAPTTTEAPVTTDAPTTTVAIGG